MSIVPEKFSATESFLQAKGNYHLHKVSGNDIPIEDQDERGSDAFQFLKQDLVSNHKIDAAASLEAVFEVPTYVSYVFHAQGGKELSECINRAAIACRFKSVTFRSPKLVRAKDRSVRRVTTGHIFLYDMMSPALFQAAIDRFAAVMSRDYFFIMVTQPLHEACHSDCDALKKIQSKHVTVKYTYPIELVGKDAEFNESITDGLSDNLQAPVVLNQELDNRINEVKDACAPNLVVV